MSGINTWELSDDPKRQVNVQYIDNVDSSLSQELEDDTNRSEVPASLKNLTPEERALAEKALVRRIDLRLMPMILLMYITNYLDRNNIGAARLTGKVGMQKSLNMTDTQYQVCVSILFVSYILCQTPSNMLLNKVGKPAIYLPCAMILWGVISAATAAATSYGGLVAIRFCLGIVEAAYFPGCLFYLSTWYTKKELSLRTALFYNGNLISGAISGLIAAGVTHGLDGARGIPAWRWLFIIEGVATISIAVTAYFVLPNLPRNTPWLSEFERDLAVDRLREDVGLEDWTSGQKQSAFHGLVLALKDPKTYLLCIIGIGINAAAGVTNFFPSVVKTLGFGSITTLLLTSPPYWLGVFLVPLHAWHADRSGERYLHIVLPLLVSILAFVLAAAATTTAAKYVAMMLMPVSFYSAIVILYSWSTSSIPRPTAKRAAALAIINSLLNSPSIYTSFLYQSKWAPRYTLAMSFNAGTTLLAIVAATILRFVLVKLNKKLDRGEHVEGAVIGDGGHANDVAAEKGFRFMI